MKDMENESTQLDLPIDEGDKEQLENGLVQGWLGASIFIKTMNGSTRIKQDYVHPELEVSVGVNVDENVNIDISSENEKGRTILVNIDKKTLSFSEKDDISILYDGKSIDNSDSYKDVLNPEDDTEPEYYILWGEKGIQVLTSIPEFSKHKIVINSSTDSGYPWLIIGGIIGAVALALGIFVTKRKGSLEAQETKTSRKTSSSSENIEEEIKLVRKFMKSGSNTAKVSGERSVVNMYSKLYGALEKLGLKNRITLKIRGEKVYLKKE